MLAADVADGDEVLVREHFTRADGHQFDETQRDGFLAREI